MQYRQGLGWLVENIGRKEKCDRERVSAALASGRKTLAILDSRPSDVGEYSDDGAARSGLRDLISCQGVPASFFHESSSVVRIGALEQRCEFSPAFLLDETLRRRFPGEMSIDDGHELVIGYARPVFFEIAYGNRRVPEGELYLNSF